MDSTTVPTNRQRVRRSPDQWRALFDHFERSGQTQEQFCAEQDLGLSTFRLAQRPGSHVILEYHRLVYKVLDDQRIVTTAAPANVLDRTVVDVSFLVGMLIDKFLYHLPLYRLHQRLGYSWEAARFTSGSDSRFYFSIGYTPY